MATATTVWGIDIGQCGLKALKLQRSGDGVEVVAFDYIEHAKILSQPDADRAALTHDALEQFLSRNPIHGEAVYVSVPGQQTFSRFTKLPPVETKRIPEIVQFEASQQIPFDMDAVVWDYQTFTSEGSPDVEVGIFAIKRDLISNALTPFRELHIEPIGVQAGPLALYNAMRFDGHMAGEGATILLDVGAENSELVISEGESIWSRNIPLGGNHFTEALVKAFKLSFSKAENLKRTAAASKYARQIFQAMRPIFADLVAEIQRSIGFYTSTHRNAKLERVVAMGNAFKLPGLQKFLQQNLGMTVERPGAFNNLGTTQASGAPQFMEHLLSFGTAYGLAVQGLGLATVNSNLLPPEITKQALWRKKQAWFAAAAACLMLAPGAIVLRYTLDKSALAATAGPGRTVRLNAEQAQQILVTPGGLRGKAPREIAETAKAAAQALSSEFNSKNQGWTAEQEKVQGIIDLQTTKGVWLQILDTIHRALPKRPPALLSSDESVDALKAAYTTMPRQQRPEVYIDSIISKYSDDVFTAVIDPAAGAGGISGPGGPDDFADNIPLGDPAPGFVIQMFGWTPNSGGSLFLTRNLVTPLNEITKREKKKFYCDRVKLVRADQRGKVAPTPAGAGGARRGGLEGLSGGGGAGNPVQVSGDPITGESTEQDYMFELTLLVILGDRPEDNAEGASGAGAR